MEVYTELNRRWKETCKVVLGNEIGDLSEYKNWLMGLNYPRYLRKSSLSGLETVFTSNEFDDDAKFVSLEEINFNKKFEPLTIDETKDIDSLVDAVQERIYYCGNIVLGESKFVERSSNITDSFFVYDSVKIDASKNIAYSQYLRLCENVFGTNEGGEGKYCIHSSILFKNTRCFEIWNSPVCSDCYYSCGLENCNETFFSFNLTGKNFVIGNLELPKEKYLQLKRKLLAEISETLQKDKKLPSLMEMVAKSKPSHTEAANALGALPAESLTNQKIIDDSFSKTSALLFGKPLTGMDDYHDWLSKNVIVPHATSSCLSKRKVPMSKWPGLSQMPPDRVVTFDEAKVLGTKMMISEATANHISIANASEAIGKIAYLTPEQLVGENKNLIECQWGFNAMNCHRSVICVNSRDCGYCSWPRNSQYCFGCGIVFDSEFSMKCYDSVKLTRCFEVDGGRGCADTYFSHNVEGLQNAIFCFNVKSKRYAVGNAEIGPEQFMKVKKMVQEWAYEELTSKKMLPVSVYDV